MAKFCGQCGAQLNDNATFCTQCGATIAPQQPAQQTASPMANLQQTAKNIDMNAIKDAVSVENIKNLKNKPNKLTIAVLAVLLVLVILVVVILCLIFGGGSWKTPINNVMDVLNDGDGKAYEELMPPYYKDMADALDGIIEISDEDFDEEAEKQRDRLTKKYGDDAEISYEVVKKTEVDSDDIDSYNDMSDLASVLSVKKAKKYKLTKAYKVKIKYTIEGEDADKTDKTTVIVGKMDGTWVLLDEGDLPISTGF